MKDFYNMFESVFDIDSNKEFDDKYTSGKSLEEIEWMIEHSHPKDCVELKSIIKQYCDEYGWDSDLNWIDVSGVDDMSYLFYNLDGFKGDISKWDVSNVVYMNYMFSNTKFNGDISKWDVSNVKDMLLMFAYSKFARDISKWNVSKVIDMNYMFKDSPLEKNPPKWYHE